MFERMLDAMHLGDDYDEYEDEEFYDEEEDKSFFNKFSKNSDEEKRPVLNKPSEKEPRASKPAPKITPMRNKGKGTVMEVCVIKPTTVEDSREIADTLLSNRTVVLNMEGLDGDIAQRVIDFTSGATYAINGNLQKISHYIFIITPPSVDISGDFPSLLNGSFDTP